MTTVLFIGIAVIVGVLVMPSHAVISTGLLTKGLRSEFFQRFEGTPTNFQDLSTRIVSTSDRETYKWLGSVPLMREFGAGRQAKGLRTESYSVENMKYESTIAVDRDEISDDQTGQIRVRVNELAQRAATHKDYLLAQLLINGATTGYNAYDGVSFFNDAHVSGASGSQDNKLTFAAATGTTPTVAEFKDSLKQAIAALMAFKDDQGAPASLAPTGLVVVVPPDLLFTAAEAMAASVGANVRNVMEGIARVLCLPWLTNSAKYYLLKTDVQVRPFVFQDREPVEFKSLTEDSEENFKREKFLFGVRARYRLAYAYWQYAVETTFT